MGFKAYFDSTTNASICLWGGDVAGMAITLMTQIEADALPRTQGPVSVSAAKGSAEHQPSSLDLSTAVWGQLCGWKVERTIYVPPTLETTFIKLWRYSHCTVLLPSVLGIHPLSLVTSKLPSLGKGDFLTAWHTQRSLLLAGAARLCNGLRSLVLPNKGRWQSIYSSYLQCQWDHGNWREAPLLHHAAPLEDLGKLW